MNIPSFTAEYAIGVLTKHCYRTTKGLGNQLLAGVIPSQGCPPPCVLVGGPLIHYRLCPPPPQSGVNHPVFGQEHLRTVSPVFAHLQGLIGTRQDVSPLAILDYPVSVISSRKFDGS